MDNFPFRLLLADDDTDDCLFFREALEELSLSTDLTTVNDGVELMQLLQYEKSIIHDVLYLDLNMPRKSGFECLSEIKLNDQLKHLPVIIFSTSYDKDIVHQLHQDGAHYYFRKPGEFSKLKQILQISLNLISKTNSTKPVMEKFVLNSI